MVTSYQQLADIFYAAACFNELGLAEHWLELATLCYQLEGKADFSTTVHLELDGTRYELLISKELLQ